MFSAELKGFFLCSVFKIIFVDFNFIRNSINFCTFHSLQTKSANIAYNFKYLLSVAVMGIQIDNFNFKWLIGAKLTFYSYSLNFLLDIDNLICNLFIILQNILCILMIFTAFLAKVVCIYSIY